MNFQFIPLHITYITQHFEPIQYINGLFNFLFILQVNAYIKFEK